MRDGDTFKQPTDAGPFSGPPRSAAEPYDEIGYIVDHSGATLLVEHWDRSEPR